MRLWGIGLLWAIGAGALAADARPGLPIEYVLVAQRPDQAGAVQVPYTVDFAACCSAFSASTVQIDHPTSPARWVQFMVHMMARTPIDAVRLRRFRYRTAADVGPMEASPAFAPPLLLAPRTVGFYLSDAAWNAEPGEAHYVLETRGAPVIYGAKLRVLYDMGGQ